MKPLSSLSQRLSLAVFAIALVGFATSAMAETAWARRHPQRHEVNRRIAHQNVRIHNEVKQGEISRDEATSLHQDVNGIRKDEREMASDNNGHLSVDERKDLNRQLNQTSKAIGN